MTAELRAETFEAIRGIVHRVAGIRLNETKQALVVSRLNKRLAHLGCGSFDAYVEHLGRSDPDGAELRQMINCLTTNKTEFFREAHHFDFLRARVLEEARARAARGGPRRLRIWSAGCSTGEEAWTIAMVVGEFLKRNPGWDVKILASDIDTDVLAHGARATYSPPRLEDLPLALRDEWFDEASGGYQVRDVLRRLVAFRRINFMDDPWPVRTRFDAIFCRNVTIYFDQATQDRFYRRLVRYLEPHAYLFAGHSENLSWLADVVTPVGGTVYIPANRAASGVERVALPVPSSASPRAASPGTVPAANRTSSSPLSKVMVQSGLLHATNEAVRLRTVLGTCVSACLWDEVAGVGGMNHFMLPDGDDPLMPTRFGVHAMELLINELMKRGADRRRLKAKAFGAAKVLRAMSSSTVAERNEQFVRQFLDVERIPLVSSRFGGSSAMEVEFEPKTGRAFVRQTETTSAITESEERYRRSLSGAANKGSADVTLF